MQGAWDHIFPGLHAAGVWAYWIVGLAVLAQGFAATAVFSPGSSLVVLAGALAARGVYDPVDLFWVIALADAAGGALGYWLGRQGEAWLEGRSRRALPPGMMDRATRFFERFGALALVLGRFLPLGSFVPLAAGLARMPARRFHLWNLAGGAAYGAGGLALGCFAGTALGSWRALESPRNLFLLGLGLTLGLAALVVWRMARRGGAQSALLRGLVRDLGRAIAQSRSGRRHPALLRWLGRRLSQSRPGGLPLTLVLLAAGWFGWLHLSGAFAPVGPGAGLERGWAAMLRVDALVNGFFSQLHDPRIHEVFALITRAGNARTVVVFAALLSLALARQRAWRDLVALWVVAIGASTTTFWLKILFARPRPLPGGAALADFSFPSGHATGAVAFYGFALFLIARRGWLRPAWAGFFALALAILIGASRLVLGVHWFSDVLYGYLVGGLWVLGGIWWLRRGAGGQRSGDEGVRAQAAAGAQAEAQPRR